MGTAIQTAVRSVDKTHFDIDVSLADSIASPAAHHDKRAGASVQKPTIGIPSKIIIITSIKLPCVNSSVISPTNIHTNAPLHIAFTAQSKNMYIFVKMLRSLVITSLTYRYIPTIITIAKRIPTIIFTAGQIYTTTPATPIAARMAAMATTATTKPKSTKMIHSIQIPPKTL